MRASLAARPDFALLAEAAEALLAALAELARRSAGLDRLVERPARERAERRAGVGREGDKRLRSLLYEAGQVLLHRVGRWTKLKAWGLKLARRVGHKKAGVAVARKLAILLYALLKRGEPFRWGQA